MPGTSNFPAFSDITKSPILIKIKISLIVGTITCNYSIWKADAEDHKFKTSLDCIVSSRPI
jgi:hypothetical protein